MNIFLLILTFALLGSPSEAAVSVKAGARSGPVLTVPAGFFGSARLGQVRPGILAAPVLGASLPGSHQAPRLAPAAAPSLEAPGAAETPAERLSGLAETIEPELEALSKPSVGTEASWDAGARLSGALSGEVRPVLPGSSDAPQGPGAAPKKARRSSPLLGGISYAPEISAEDRAFLNETLSRRKAGWTRQLKAMGLDLAAGAAPTVSVKSSRDLPKIGKVEFVVEWNRGERFVGAFRAVVARKNLDPELRRLPAPEPPKERQIRLRFKKSAPEAGVAAVLEKLGLRLLSKSWDGFYMVAVTGKNRAETVAKKLAKEGPVLYATPSAQEISEADQLRLIFKSGAGEDEIAATLNEFGLRVLEVKDGSWRVGAERLSKSGAAARIGRKPAVFYATPLKDESSWTRQVVLTFKDGTSQDDMADFFRRRGLRVSKDLGGGAFRLSALDPEPVNNRELSASLGLEDAVASAVALGTVSDDSIRASAQGVASYKGRPWSSTEYNLNYAMGYDGLERRGATPQQLDLFRKLCDEAPMRGGGFNPWSGD